ncbi:sulfite exporter TauE/SafE family protein [Aerococcaceae bacterium DSM 111020]|nr:sulfite exporter TauE/SafE family protein [Aerococcaceae bacterium DSM 111020]
MAQFIAVFFGTLLGGFVQATAGFGFAIMLMLFVPYFLGIVDSGTLSIMIAFPLNVLVFIQYRQHVNFRKVWLPILSYVLTSITVINLLGSIDLVVLKRLFGVFLIILGLYYLLLQGRVNIKSTITNAIVCGVISGISGGLFSIGGPLMSLYYLGISDSREEYMGSLNFQFTCSSLANNLTRFATGLMHAQFIPFLLFGFIGMFIGKQAGGNVAEKLPAKVINNLIYTMIIVSGINALIG